MLNHKDYVGGIPVIVHLNEQDILSLARRPPPLAFVLPRTTLLIAILRDVLEFFSPYGAVLNQYTTQVWFSYECMVVPWGYPVGAVRDLVQELHVIRRRSGQLNRSRGTDSMPPQHFTHSKQAGVGGFDAAGDSSRRPLIFPFSSEPLELEFRIYQPSGFKTIERCAPFLVNFDRIDEYIRNEIKQLHKTTYSAIYGAYKNYLNSPESVLQAAIGMALYRPFEASSASDFLESSLAGPRTFPAFTSPYLLSEYHHMLKSVSRARRLTYVVQLSFPWLYRSGKDGPVLRFHTHPVDAAPPARLGSPGGRPEGQGRSACESPREADFFADADEEALTLGLLLWRLFCAPCLGWRRRFSLPSSSPACTASASDLTDAVVAWDGAAENETVLLRSMAVFYTDPPASPTTDLEEHEMPYEYEQRSKSWALWEAAMSEQFIEAYEGNSDGCLGESIEAGAIFGIPVVADKTEGNDHEYEPQRIFFKIQGVVPSLRTSAKFLETYMASSDRSLFLTVGVR